MRAVSIAEQPIGLRCVALYQLPEITVHNIDTILFVNRTIICYGAIKAIKKECLRFVSHSSLETTLVVILGWSMFLPV